MVLLNLIRKRLLNKEMQFDADVLNDFDEIKAAVSYSINGENFENIPFELSQNIIPQYKSIKGWNKDISKITNKNELPLELKEYISFIEDFVKVPIIMVSVGPDRKAIVDLR